MTLTTWEKAEGRKCWLAWVAAWVMWEKKMWPSERARVGRPKVSLIYGAAGGERAGIASTGNGVCACGRR